MAKDKITPPGWYEAEEDQRVIFFEGKASRADLWSGRAWLNGVIISLFIYIGLAILVLLLIWIRK